MKKLLLPTLLFAFCFGNDATLKTQGCDDTLPQSNFSSQGQNLNDLDSAIMACNGKDHSKDPKASKELEDLKKYLHPKKYSDCVNC
ncbi:hypothetical protein BKH46_08080 [Helicobacter sp. 12S02634-8]|uniref:hypothetical protein n=1 Tax=Helicobacter sp. 12S02634-8 TaxID=1476199 RepID=UPI000BA6475E|nr:hypothetical protein [Helicobacter sp. 12S02634-8]PAF46335.1 hypothetical protein BKH46_08080 [Helicobacter sp. 12S02634-8]